MGAYDRYRHHTRHLILIQLPWRMFSVNSVPLWLEQRLC